MLPDFLEFTLNAILRPDFSMHSERSYQLSVGNCLVVGTANRRFTPAEGDPLSKNVHGEPTPGNFNYISMVGMLLCLVRHTHPDITYAVNCAARYIFCPKLVHDHVLTLIGCYLKATSNKGLIIKPSEKLLKIGSFADADFAGMYGCNTMNHTVCIKSRTGYVIVVANWPIMWQSKLQSETAQSTMEAEIITIDHTCCKMSPIMDGVNIMDKAIGFPVGNTSIQDFI